MQMVMTIHGIWTPGRWQKRVGDLITDAGFQHRSIDYGSYIPPRLLLKGSRQRKIDWFFPEYTAKQAESRQSRYDSEVSPRPSLIAHSFGSYIAGYAMLKYEEIRFDKVVLCGSILPRDFPWSTLFERDQVLYVLNEYGAKDFWAKTAKICVGGAGDSGACGFRFASTRIKQKRLDHYRHSDFFKDKHIQDSWITFLQEPSPRLAVRHGSDLMSLAEFRDVLQPATRRLDDQVYSKAEGFRETRAPRDAAADWIRIEPDIYTFLIDRRDDQCIGYVNAMPIADGLLTRILDGGVEDHEIAADDVVPLVDRQEVDLYLLSIAIAEDRRKMGEGLINYPFETLVYGFINKYLNLAVERGVRIRKIVAAGWTPEGRRLCEQVLRMKPQGVDQHKYPIYFLDFTAARQQLASLSRYLRDLDSTYREIGF